MTIMPHQTREAGVHIHRYRANLVGKFLFLEKLKEGLDISTGFPFADPQSTVGFSIHHDGSVFMPFLNGKFVHYQMSDVTKLYFAEAVIQLQLVNGLYRLPVEVISLRDGLDSVAFAQIRLY